MPGSSPLAHTLRALSKELDEFARECRTAASSPEKAADLPDAVLGLVLTKYRGALLILDRIADEAMRLKPLFSQFRTPGSIESDPVRRAAFDEMLSLASYLRLDIESLYLWTHEIKEALQHSGHRIDLSQLERIAFVRNKFITHLSKQPVFKESEYFGRGTRYGPDCEDVQLFLHPLDVSGVME